MKKIILSLVLVSAFTFVNAQDVLKSKNGTPILPEKGDWAISVSATPFLDYFGNFLSQHGNTSPYFDFLNSDNYIAGKYFVNANTAYRAKVRIGLGSSSTTNSAGDETKISATNITLGAGMEKRRGHGRLQGIYGAEALIQLTGGKTTYTYATTPDLGTVLSDKQGSGFGFGVRGFIGAEYFILPKISLGAEYGWGLMINSVGKGTIQHQGEADTSTPKTSSFGLDTDISPVIVLTLHF